MSDPEITTGGRERHLSAVKCLSKCFIDDPITTFFIQQPRDARITYMNEFFSPLIKAAVMNDAIITETNDYSTTAVWMPPGKKVDNWATNFQAGLLKLMWDLGVVGIWRMMVDYEDAVEGVKKRVLGKYPQGYYYCFFIGTVDEMRGRGHGSRLVKHWQERAGRESVPIWLEATTPESHRLYLREGFEDVEMLRIGKGKVDERGEPEKGGKGVPLWTMIWVPPAKEVEMAK